jgi:hypothetical protein
VGYEFRVLSFEFQVLGLEYVVWNLEWFSVILGYHNPTVAIPMVYRCYTDTIILDDVLVL